MLAQAGSPPPPAAQSSVPVSEQSYQINLHYQINPASRYTTTLCFAGADGTMSVKTETLVADEETTDARPTSIPIVPPHMQQPALGSNTFTQPSYGFTDTSLSGRIENNGTTQQQPRVPLPPQHSRSDPTLPSPTGPMNRSWTPPPRPRPGRKPIPQEDAADRRRLQNRIAQRNFRDKRQQKLYETQQELEMKKNEYQDHVSELERKLDEQKRDVKALRQQGEELTRRLREAELRAQRAEAKLQQPQQPLYGIGGNPAYAPAPLQANAASLGINTNQAQLGMYGASSVLTPPEDSHFGMEQDFTRWRGPSNQQSNALRPTTSNDSAGMSFPGGMDISSDGTCGFCTNDEICPCKQREQVAECAPEPGTCAACQADPQRAEACKELALGTIRASSRPSTSEGLMAPPAPRMSCTSMVDHFRSYGMRTSSISELFGGQLQAYPSARNGFDLDEREAAQVLSTLSRRGTMVSQQDPNEGPSFGDASQ